MQLEWRSYSWICLAAEALISTSSSTCFRSIAVRLGEWISEMECHRGKYDGNRNTPRLCALISKTEDAEVELHIRGPPVPQLSASGGLRWMA